VRVLGASVRVLDGFAVGLLGGFASKARYDEVPRTLRRSRRAPYCEAPSTLPRSAQHSTTQGQHSHLLPFSADGLKTFAPSK
jgi:hypothetical protein